MGDASEEYRKSIREFIDRAQKIHFLLIAFCFVLFVFGFIEIRKVQERKDFAEANAKRYSELINYSQSVASEIRRYLLLHYPNIAPVEESRIFALISDIEKARTLIPKLRKRMLATVEKRPNVLPLVDETKISLVQLNGALNPLEELLYCRDWILADTAIGSFLWYGTLQDHSIDDLARLAYAISVSPDRIIDCLSAYASEEVFEPGELDRFASTLGRLLRDSQEGSGPALRFAADRLWVEWLNYKNSSLLKTAEVETANTSNLVRLYIEAQAELDNLTSWEKGDKGVVLPGIPGEVPLALSIWCAPFVGSVAFALGIIFVIRATQIVEKAKSKKIGLELENCQVPYVLALRPRGSLLGRILLYLAQFVVLFFPLSVMICIGLLNPALWPLHVTERLAYWVGVSLSLILTLLFARECTRFRKASEWEDGTFLIS